jgi:hypothetical protein
MPPVTGALIDSAAAPVALVCGRRQHGASDLRDLIRVAAGETSACKPVKEYEPDIT